MSSRQLYIFVLLPLVAACSTKDPTPTDSTIPVAAKGILSASSAAREAVSSTGTTNPARTAEATGQLLSTGKSPVDSPGIAEIPNQPAQAIIGSARLKAAPGNAANGANTTGISIAMIAMGSNEKVSFEAIRRDLATNWPELPPAANHEQDEFTLSFRVGEADVILGLMPAPIPWSGLEEACATSVLWPDAEKVLKSHQAHVIVTVTGPLSPVDRAKLLTQVSAAVMGTNKSALGISWGNARLVLPSAMFRDFAIKFLPEKPPLHMWVNFRVGRNKDGKTSSGFTLGFEDLGHMELETSNAYEPVGELRKRLMGLVEYLIENGPVIRDGETIGESDAERIRVVYSQSAFGNKNRVMRLDYGSEQSNPQTPETAKPDFATSDAGKPGIAKPNSGRPDFAPPEFNVPQPGSLLGGPKSGSNAKPRPSGSSGGEMVALEADANLKVGDKLKANWGGKWYDVEVLAVLPDGKVRIHWVGWEASWDETRDRTKLYRDVRALNESRGDKAKPARK